MFKATSYPKVIFLMAYIALFICISYKGYFLGDSVFILGAGILVYVLKAGTPGNKSMRFLIPTLLLTIVSFYVPTFSIRYLLLIVALLFCFETLFGKLSELAFLVLLLMSPLFRYVAESFTFPIRIWLSEISGQILSFLHFPVEINGNMIVLNGNDFLVDAACTGLQMLGLSFLMCIFLLAYYQDIYQKKLTFGWQLLALTITFLLNILSNLCRILLLVIFRITPDNFLHDVLGICCLLIYVWLPMVGIIRQIALKQVTESVEPKIEETGLRQWIMNGLFLSVTAYLILSFTGSTKAQEQIITEKHEKANYQAKVLNTGITQMKSDKALVYLKPIPDFYSGEHSPIFCWKGSGYTFEKIKEEIVQSYPIYTGVLTTKNDKLYTAWWFTNGEVITNSQLEWRWRVLKGEHKFKLINVTADSEHELKKVIAEWL
ncbi:exosortase N [Emticicia agri]|uniref:Exosortase N n=1 Tax=Emticicia agri TaxID=2492393 RepID=A0A4Q5LW16_9BACT|nr:exosortase N [Emticicia agri]RYU93683.1 exosortase N [Emticicia agri]